MSVWIDITKNNRTVLYFGGSPPFGFFNVFDDLLLLDVEFGDSNQLRYYQ